MNDANGAVLECRNIARRFSEGDSILEVLSGVNLRIAPAERVAIIGASGSGKTTLLQILGGLDDPDDGEVFVGGEAMNGGNETWRGELRNRYIGFVYQFHHLLPEFTAEENVAMPLLIRRMPKAEALQQAGRSWRDLQHTWPHAARSVVDAARASMAVFLTVSTESERIEVISQDTELALLLLKGPNG